MQALRGAGIHVTNTSSCLPPFKFLDSSWQRPFSAPFGRCEGAGGQCSGEVFALFKRCVWRLQRFGIRCACGGWCSAAWLIAHIVSIAHIPWVSVWRRHGAGSCCCLQVGRVHRSPKTFIFRLCDPGTPCRRCELRRLMQGGSRELQWLGHGCRG